MKVRVSKWGVHYVRTANTRLDKALRGFDMWMGGGLGVTCTYHENRCGSSDIGNNTVMCRIIVEGQMMAVG